MTQTIEQAAIAKVLERIHSDFVEKRLPEYMWGGIERYLIHGIPPGHFLTAVLCNDLKEAVCRADDTNQDALVDWVKFLYNAVPGGCWGSPKRFNAWIESRGMLGGAE